MYKIGQEIWFVAAQKKICSVCDQHIPNLDYTIEQARIQGISTEESGYWKEKKTCNCKKDCLCKKKTDYSEEPEISTRKQYSINSEKHGLIYVIPEASLFTTQEQAQVIMETPKTGCVIMIRPKTEPILIPDVPPLVASDLPE